MSKRPHWRDKHEHDYIIPDANTELAHLRSHLENDEPSQESATTSFSSRKTRSVTSWRDVCLVLLTVTSMMIVVLLLFLLRGQQFHMSSLNHGDKQQNKQQQQALDKIFAKLSGTANKMSALLDRASEREKRGGSKKAADFRQTSSTRANKPINASKLGSAQIARSRNPNISNKSTADSGQLRHSGSRKPTMPNKPTTTKSAPSGNPAAGKPAATGKPTDDSGQPPRTGPDKPHTPIKPTAVSDRPIRSDSSKPTEPSRPAGPTLSPSTGSGRTKESGSNLSGTNKPAKNPLLDG